MQSDGITGLWGIILAAGEGRRLRRFVHERFGLHTPKQYVVFIGKRSMLQHTIDRAEKVIRPEKIQVVVAANHQKEIGSQLCGRPEGTVIIQPQNRETAPGILLPLTHIVKKDPQARVAIFPSDQFILEEDRFIEHVSMADRVIQSHPDQVVLLGIRASDPETDYGWIVPGELLDRRLGLGVRRVSSFLEKPDAETAVELLKKGALWNTFVIVATAKTLMEMTQRYLPEIWKGFASIFAAIGTTNESVVLEREYRCMQSATLSHGVLERCPDRISVVEVDNVFWSDWGDADRVITTLKKIGKLSDPVSESDVLSFSPQIAPEKNPVALAEHR